MTNFDDYLDDLKAKVKATKWLSKIGESGDDPSILWVNKAAIARRMMTDGEDELEALFNAMNDANNSLVLEYRSKVSATNPKDWSLKLSEFSRISTKCVTMGKKLSAPLRKASGANGFCDNSWKHFEYVVSANLLCYSVMGESITGLYAEMLSYYLGGHLPCGYAGDYPYGQLIVF